MSLHFLKDFIFYSRLGIVGCIGFFEFYSHFLVILNIICAVYIPKFTRVNEPFQNKSSVDSIHIFYIAENRINRCTLPY